MLCVGMLLAGALVAVTGASTRAQQEQEVALREFAIEPAAFTVGVGETVRFNVTNQGAREHNLEVESEAAGIEQVLFPSNLQPGQGGTVEVTFSQPGTWELYCPLGQHRERGMLASVQVHEATEAPALEPQESPPPPTATTAPSSPPAPPPPSRRGY
jgi:plastocyanin